MHVAQALTRSVSFETRRHLRAAFDQLDPDAPAPLVACRNCGRTMHPDRLPEHKCVSYKENYLSRMKF